MIDGNSEHLFAKLVPFMNKYIFANFTDNYVSCDSTHKCNNLYFYGETTKIRKNVLNLSWTEIQWIYKSVRGDIVLG